jgi:predicted Fe-Mo cluster-binding NifX family protein
MIVGIPINSNSRNSEIALRFARAKYFAVIHRENNSLEIIPNPCLGMETQAGKCTLIYLMSRKNIDTIIAYEFGLNAQQIAQENNIQIILIKDNKRKLKDLFKIMNFKTEESYEH